MKDSSDGAREELSGAIKVIGIGQSLRGDDAAGLAAVQLWRQRYPATAERPDVQVELSELPGIGLLSLLEGSRVAILVDAIRSDAKPGTIHILSEDQLDTFQPEAGSAHGWGVAETLSLGRKLRLTSLPRKLVLIGIEAGQLNMGESLSSEVEAALPEVARQIEQLVNQ
jgi:hydrogenase maturation protease